jgi:hypothetical protein
VKLSRGKRLKISKSQKIHQLQHKNQKSSPSTITPALRRGFLLRSNNQMRGAYMAIKLISRYSKRLGLPGYSSHEFSVCVESEINSMDDVKNESARLYDTLQSSIDDQIQQTGFVPESSYGKEATSHRPLPSRNGNGNGHTHQNGSDIWACTDRQKELLLKLVADNNLDKQEVENLAAEWQRVPVKTMNKLMMSAFIRDIIDHYDLQNKPRRSIRPAHGPRPR